MDSMSSPSSSLFRNEGDGLDSEVLDILNPQGNNVPLVSPRP